MDPEQMMREAFAAFEAHDLQRAFKDFADDVVITNSQIPGAPWVTKSEFIKLNDDFLKAFPDFKFNVQSLKQEGDKVMVTVRVTGTHTGVLASPFPNSPPIPPTGKKISLPLGYVVTTKNGQVIAFHQDTPPEGNTEQLFKQLGIPLHSA